MKVLFLLLFVASAFCPRLTQRRPPFSIDATFYQRKPQTNSQSTANVVNEYCIPLENISLVDLPKVGGKAASLGEMIQHLKPLGVAVPGGFAITSAAYEAVLDQFQLRKHLQDLLQNVDVTNLDKLAKVGLQAREMIKNAGLPDDVRKAIAGSYQKLCLDPAFNESYNVSVAVRSSATAEDLPTASFAGQRETFLNVVGHGNVCDAVLDCLASVFTDRAISYNVHNNYNHMKVKGAAIVQLMVRSDLASSGVAFTLDPDTGFRDVVVITGSYGLGESVVGGKVDPDEVQVFKPMIGKAEDPVIRRRIGQKQISIVCSHASEACTKTIETNEADQAKPSFSDEDAIHLAKLCVDIEQHYSGLNGNPTPMDIEWAKDGITGKIYVVQARPETVRSRKKQNMLHQTLVANHGESIINGTAIGSDAATGKVRVLHSLSDVSSTEKEDILVADITDPDWVPAIRMASAVVTNRGGRTCHAAIVSRELGVPCIVGTKDATEKLKTGETFTVDCSRGITGYVYEGEADIKRTEMAALDLPETKTGIELILGDPDAAFALSSLPVAGVGTIRQEFVVANHIGIHPNAVIFPERVSEETRKQISERACNDPSLEDFFVRKLSEGIASIAAAFYPRPVIVRLGDFKSNEYRSLIGGECFEPKEENPMLGLRGASRYLHPEFQDAFKLECRAISYVRDKMGLRNVNVMVPFCRNTEEARGVLDLLEANGLKRGDNGLEVWLVCEIPANVLSIDEFAPLFDGISIGSNDLTQLVLGVDRDSGELANVFDENDPAVKIAIAQAIEGAHRNGIPVGFVGQAPSDKPDFAAFLVEKGIDSMSLTPDSALRTFGILARAEKELNTIIGDDRKPELKKLVPNRKEERTRDRVIVLK